MNAKMLQRLYRDITRKLATLDNPEIYKIKGIELNFLEIKTLQMYCEFALRDRLHALVKLSGTPATVWEKYKIGGID